MARKSKKHETPENLDPLFDRGAISEDMYQDFWRDYWKSDSDDDRENVIEFYMNESIEDRVAEALEEDEAVEELPLRGSITRKIKEAERQAEIIGGYVARRTKSGKFSKRGTYYQAMRRKRKRK